MDLPQLGVCMVRSKQEPEVGIQLCNATSCANSYRELGSLTFCSSINKFCFWWKCIQNDSQLFILTPLLQSVNSSMVCFVFPDSCYLICVGRKLKQGCLFLCIQYVLFLYALSLMICQSVQHMNYCRCCISICISHQNLFWIIYHRVFVYGAVAGKAMFRLVCLNILVTLCINQGNIFWTKRSHMYLRQSNLLVVGCHIWCWQDAGVVQLL